MPWPNSYLSTNEQISGLTNKHRRGVYLFELTAGGIAHPLVRRKQVENGTCRVDESSDTLRPKPKQ